jgi:hypothetical protein
LIESAKAMTSDPPESGCLDVGMVRGRRGRFVAFFEVLALFNAQLPSWPLTENGMCHQRTFK